MTDRERYTFNVTRAAEYLDIAPTTLYGIAERGEIDHLRTRGNTSTCVRAGKTVRVPGRLKFSQAGLDSWIAERRSPVQRQAPLAPAAPSRPSLPMPVVRRFAR